MALQTPSHHLPTPHLGASGRQYLRDLLVALALAIAVLLVFGATSMLRPVLPQLFVTQPQTAPLVEFRAGERASWAEGQTPESQSILLYRAAERGGQ
jgi:hypothetical protein